MKAARNVTVGKLQSGEMPRITRREFAQLRGCSEATLERDAWQGKGTPYCKDENGRVWYAAEDVLASLQGKKYKGTHEYDTTSHVARLEKARAARG